MDSTKGKLGAALSTLTRYGFLLESDLKLPSVASIVVGHRVHGSWWAHPKAHEIHYVASQIAAHPAVLVTRLVSRKITYVHRKLWPAILAVGSSRQDWQLNGLTPRARELLLIVHRAGRVRTDLVPRRLRLKGKTIGDAARELEGKLLVVSREVHTESGKHAKELEAWRVWRKNHRVTGRPFRPEDAKIHLEKALGKLNGEFGARSFLPWT